MIVVRVHSKAKVALVMRVSRAAYHAAAAISLCLPPLTMIVVRVHSKAKVALIMRVSRAAYHAAAAISLCLPPLTMVYVRATVKIRVRAKVSSHRAPHSQAEHPRQRSWRGLPVKRTPDIEAMEPDELDHFVRPHLDARRHTVCYEAILRRVPV
jgi:hypothetical protein